MDPWVKRDNPHIEVEAIRLNENNVEVLAQLIGADLITEIDPERPEETQYGLNVRTADGKMQRASLGMYVVRVGGTYFASHVRPFEVKYRPRDRAAPPPESAGDSRKARGFADPFDMGRMGP